MHVASLQRPQLRYPTNAISYQTHNKQNFPTYPIPVFPDHKQTSRLRNLSLSLSHSQSLARSPESRGDESMVPQLLLTTPQPRLTRQRLTRSVPEAPMFPWKACLYLWAALARSRRPRGGPFFPGLHLLGQASFGNGVCRAWIFPRFHFCLSTGDPRSANDSGPPACALISMLWHLSIVLCFVRVVRGGGLLNKNRASWIWLWDCCFRWWVSFFTLSFGNWWSGGWLEHNLGYCIFWVEWIISGIVGTCVMCFLLWCPSDLL